MNDAPTNPIAFVRRFNAWRRGDDSEQPQPYQIGQALDALCNHAEQLERELAAERETTQRLYDRLERREGYLYEYKVAYSSERALADRLAGELESWSRIAGDYTPMDADKALAAWKASRDQNNLEGAGPTEEERRENARAIQAMTVPERFALMFRNQTKEEP